MVNFPTWIPDCDSHSPALFGFFISFDAIICSRMGSPPLGNSVHVIASVFPDFPSRSKWDIPFHCIAYDYSCTDCDNLRDHLRDVPWDDIFELSASATTNELLEGVQVGIDVYIPHRKCQVKLHSSPWFSDACAAAIAYRNYFFRLYQWNKLHASNCCKIVVEAGKLAYANKTKESISSQKLGYRDFWRIANSALKKGPEGVAFCCDKARFFAQNFPGTLTLMTQDISLPVFPSRTNLKLHNFSVTPKMVKKVITNLD